MQQLAEECTRALGGSWFGDLHRTVEKHLERLRQRLGIPNKARRVAWALQQGLGSAEGPE